MVLAGAAGPSAINTGLTDNKSSKTTEIPAAELVYMVFLPIQLMESCLISGPPDHGIDLQTFLQRSVQGVGCRLPP